MKFSVLHATAAASLAALLLLSGCALLPSIPSFGGDDSSSDNNDNNDNDSGGGLDEEEIEENPFLDNVVPEGFPSDVPLPDLEIYLGLSVAENSWSIIYQADDLESDFANIVSMYEGDGWEVLMSNTSSDGAFGVFEKDSYTVQAVGIADGETDFDGPGISITVVRTN